MTDERSRSRKVKRPRFHHLHKIQTREQRIAKLKIEIARMDRAIDGIQAQIELAKETRKEMAKALRYEERVEKWRKGKR